MAIELGEYVISVYPSLRGASKAINSQMRDVDTTDTGTALGKQMQGGFFKGWDAQAVGTKIQSLGGNISSVGQTLTSKFTKPVAGAATAVSGLVAGLGFKRLVGIDTARGQFQGLGYDADAVMAQVSEGVNNTSLSMAQGASAAVGILATGAVPLEQLEAQIKRVANVSAAYNVDAEQAAYLLNNVLTKNKVTWGDLSQMQMNGIPIVSQLADMYGVAGDEIMKMAQDGEISIEDLNTALDTNAGNAAEAYAGTWKGVTANITSNLGKLGAKFMEPTFDLIKVQAERFLELLRSPTWAAFAEDMGQRIGAFVESTIDKISQLISWWTNLDRSTQQTILTIAGVVVAAGPVLQIIGKLVTTVGGLVKGFGLLQGAVGGIAAPLVIGVAVFAAMFAASEDFRNAIMGLVEVIVGSLMGVFQALWPVIQQVGQILWDLAGTLGDTLAPVVSLVADALGTLMGAITPLIASLAGALVPIIKIVADVFATVIAAVVPLVETFIGALMPVLTAVINAITPLVQILGAILAPVIQFVGAIITNVLLPPIQWLAEKFLGLIEIISGPVTWAFEKLGDGLSWVADKLGLASGSAESTNTSIAGSAAGIEASGESMASGFSFSMDSMLGATTGALGGMTSAFGSSSGDITSTVSGMGATASGDWDKALADMLADTTSDTSSITSQIAGMGSGVTRATATAGGQMASGWDANLGSMLSGTKSDMSGVSGAVSKESASAQKAAMESVMKLQRDWAAQMRAMNSATLTQMRQITAEMQKQGSLMESQMARSGSTIGNNFASGLRSSLSAAKSVASNALGAIRRLFPFSPAKEGPFSGKGWVSYAGESVGDTFTSSAADAILAGRSSIDRALAPVADDFRLGSSVGSIAAGGFALDEAAGSDSPLAHLSPDDIRALAAALQAAVLAGFTGSRSSLLATGRSM